MVERNEEIHVETEKARAGETPHITRYVMGVSLVLVIVALAAVIWLSYG